MLTHIQKLLFVSSSDPGLEVLSSTSPPTRIVPELLMVGVMTTSKFLSTRACAVFKTWAPHIQGKVC